MKKNNKILAIFIIAISLLCFVGCNDSDDTQKDNSSIDVSSSAGNNNTSKVPIVIIEDEDASNTQSETDEIINDWENATPDIEVEINSSSDSSITSSDSSDTTSSNGQNTSDDGFENQESSDASSSDDNISKPQRPDDGYFDVAV